MRRFFIVDKYNTWYDWRLTLTAKATPDPEIKTNYIELDGVSGTLDATEALTGEVAYRDRAVTASFLTSEGSYAERRDRLRLMSALLHGKKVKIVEPDDPDHYFLGRVSVKNPKNHPAYSTVDLEAVCEPWRYALEETERTVDVSGSTDVVIHNGGVKTLCPVVTVTDSVTLSCNGYTVALSVGAYKIPDLRLVQGANVVSLSGSGSVTFTYREAGI